MLMENKGKWKEHKEMLDNNKIPKKILTICLETSGIHITDGHNFNT